MANRRFEETGYRPFRPRPLLAEGLLAVDRSGGGDVLDKVSSALFRVAAEAGAVADRQAARQEVARARLDHAADPLKIDPGSAPTIGGNGRARGGSFAGPVNAAIDAAAARHGVDAATLRTIAQIESGGNPRAKNPRSSAGGLFQFIDSTASQFGLADRFDPAQASDAAARLLKANAGHLRRVLGRDPTPGELYLAHQQGAGGAAKLLANPGARAVDVVGAQAVRLNGGGPNMTSGQFARQWIDKAENGYVIPASGEMLAGTPPSVTGGRWRPKGDDTIRGRAYDEERARLVILQLDSEMRSTTAQLFERHRDDPAGLERSLGDLKGQLARDHVLPEYAADFDISYNRIAQTYLGQARENAQAKAREQDRAAFLESGQTLTTDLQRRIETGDPTSEGWIDGIASAQEAVDAYYDAAVSRGEIGADDAVTLKATKRREAALGFYGRQAEAKDADGVAAMRKAMQADYADGGIDGLDAAGWQQLDAGLQALETKKKNDATRAAAAFRERGDGFAARLAAGTEIDQGELDAYMLEAGATPEGRTAREETMAKISAARFIRDMSVRDAEKYVAGLKKQYGAELSESELRRLGFAEATLAAKKQAIATDSVSYAEAQGIVPATPLLTEAGDAGEMAGIMRARTATAAEAAAALGVAPRYLKAGEAKAVADAIRGNPATGASIAAAIVQGSRGSESAVLSEFGQDAPMIAEAGAILAFGGSARAAEDVILGYGKGADGKALKGLKADAARESFRGVAGGALALAPKDRERIDRAAAAIARKRITEEGLDPASEEALAIHAQAVHEAAGAVFDRGVQFGGFTGLGGSFFRSERKVLVPPSIRADLFGDVIGAVTDDDLKALRVRPRGGITAVFGRPQETSPAGQLRIAVPVAVAGGYAFAIGDPAGPDPQFIQGTDGNVFVLDLEAMRDRLAARVPGAFR